MNNKQSILVVEDDKSIYQFIATVLSAGGYTVLQASTGQMGLTLTSSHCPDLMLLDLGLPDMDGAEVIRQLRTWSAMPVVVVSARADEKEKVRALDLGADDYITKPFGTDELLARIRTALRHGRTTLNPELANRGQFAAGELFIDFNSRRVSVQGEAVHLTQIEFRIIELLSKYAGRVLTYDYIIRAVWGPNARMDNQILRVNMANIRRKLEKNPAEPQYIFTEVGVGYRMAENGEYTEN